MSERGLADVAQTSVFNQFSSTISYQPKLPTVLECNILIYNDNWNDKAF